MTVWYFIDDHLPHLVIGIVAVAVIVVAVMAWRGDEPLPEGCERHSEFSHFQPIVISTGKSTITQMQPIYRVKVVCETPPAQGTN